MLCLFCDSSLLSLSSQPGSAGSRSGHEQHEHAHADAHEWRIPPQQPPRRSTLQPPSTSAQPRPPVQQRRGPAHDGAAAGPGPRRQRELLGRRLHERRAAQGGPLPQRRAGPWGGRAGFQGPRTRGAQRRTQQHEWYVGQFSQMFSAQNNKGQLQKVNTNIYSNDDSAICAVQSSR